MIKYEIKDYGLYLKFSGIISINEATELTEWTENIVQLMDSSSNVFVDMQEMEILPADCKEKIEEVQKILYKKGYSRSVVILSNEITAMQFKLIAKKTGIYEFERYIDASNNEDWEQFGMDWLLNAVDPDKKLQQT